MNTKDLFSGHASLYASFRPTYPAALFDYIDQFVPKKDRAWDCATGNGQIAQHLATRYTEVIATDISETQLANAFQANNIRYKVCPAERTPFPSQYVDLITEDKLCIGLIVMHFSLRLNVYLYLVEFSLQ